MAIESDDQRGWLIGIVEAADAMADALEHIDLGFAGRLEDADIIDAARMLREARSIRVMAIGHMRQYDERRGHSRVPCTACDSTGVKHRAGKSRDCASCAGSGQVAEMPF